MKDEKEMNILIMGAFTMCPRTGQTMLANDCLECENIVEENGNYTCIYDEEADSESVRVLDLVLVLLELVENGKTHINRTELAGILGLKDN
jgi:hypothetical protein